MDYSQKLEILKLAAGLGNNKSIHSLVYDWWHELNTTHFNTELQPAQIIIGVTEYSGCLGHCGMVEGQSRITLHKGIAAPGWIYKNGSVSTIGTDARDLGATWSTYGAVLGRPFMRNVLLHEMMHSAQSAFYMSDPAHAASVAKDAHHCPSWSELCNRIAPQIGLDDVWFPVYARRKGKKDASGKRKNIWVPIDADQCPAGKRIAEFNEISSFPHTSKKPGDYNSNLKGVSWTDLRNAWGKYQARRGS